MRLRAFALLLALLVVTAPVLGAVCSLACEQPRTTAPKCHESETSPSGPAVRAPHHGCDHDHTVGSLALLAGTNARDSLSTSAAMSVPRIADSPAVDLRVAFPAMHGPPGPSDRRPSVSIAVLRI